MSTKPSSSRPVPNAKKPAVRKPAPYDPAVTVIEDLDSPYTSPLQVTPVQGASYGLGLRHIEGGVDFIFERWFELREGDTYRIYFGNVSKADSTITAAQVSEDRFFLNVPRESLGFQPGMSFLFIPDVYGEVLRIGSSTPSTSPPQIVFIKQTRPGGIDKGPFEQWHSELHLTLRDKIIGAGQSTTATIKAWEHMRVNDLVMFYWGGNRFEIPRITPEQVGQDLTFEIDEAFIVAAGSGEHAVAFYLYDEVLNMSGELQHWSKPVHISVNLQLTLLPEPFILEADLDLMALDADALGKEPANALVEIPFRNPPLFRIGDEIVLTVHGMTFDGTYISESFRQSVKKVPDYLYFPIRNEVVRSFLLSTMVVDYVRIRALTEDLPSRSASVAVIGQRYDLPKPSVNEAHGPFIAPDHVRITVNMPDYQPSGSPGDALEVRLNGLHVDNTQELVTSTRLAGTPPRTRDFENALYMRLEGLRDTNVHYIVHGATGSRESERLWVQIGRPPRDQPAPVIWEAVNGNVDPKTVGSVGTLELRANFKQGDIVTVHYTGSNSGLLQEEYTLFMDANPLLIDISKNLFLDNIDGTLTVSYWIDRGGVYLYSEELVVSIGTALGELFLAEVLQATTEPDELDPMQVWPNGATVRLRYDSIKPKDKVEVKWVGLAGAGSYFEIKENQSGDHIDFTVPSDVIGFNIHPLGRDILVSFTVIRNGFATDSPVLTLRLLSLHHPSGPVIDSIGEDAVLHVPLLADFDETRVPAWPYAKVGQRMWLAYDGTRNTGAAYKNEIFRARPVDVSEALYGVSSETPVLALRNLQEWSELTIRFWVAFDHSDELDNAVLFEVRHHRIELVSATFPFPKIKDSVPQDEQVVSINPLSVENKCQVLVSYPNMNQGGTDRVTLNWIYADGSIAYIATQDGLDGGTVTFNIKNDLIARSVNSTIHLQYSVELGRGGSAVSEEQTVVVGTILPASLPRALINNVAHGGSLNPPGFTGDGLAASQKWPLSLAGQRVWLTLTTNSSGIAPLPVLVNHSLTPQQQANGLANIAVSRAWLLSLPNNARITLHLKVTFNGSQDESDAVPFPTTEYTISLLSPLVVDTSTAFLSTRTYLIPGNPGVLPAFGSGNSVRRAATGGTAPYSYSSNNTAVAVVDSTGLVTVRGNGTATITVRDSSLPAQTRSYAVSVSGVVLCYGLGGGGFAQIRNNASSQGLRLASIDELRALSNAYGSRWPMGNFSYWSSTYGGRNLLFDYYYGRNINTGAEANFKVWAGNNLLGVGLR